MDFMTRIDAAELSAFQINSMVGIAIAVGIFYCFLGYRVLKIAIGLTGFIIAGSVAVIMVGWISEYHLISMLIALLIGGISGAFALFFLYRTGVFSIGLLGAALVANNVLGDRPESWSALAVLGFGFLGGLVALIIERPVMMAATSAIGAWMIVSGGLFYLYGPTEISSFREVFNVETERHIELASWAVLASVGFLVQVTSNKTEEE